MGVDAGSAAARFEQVHGTDVGRRAPGHGRLRGTRPEADIIVSDDPSVAIGVRVADCAPILLFDATTNAVGAAHAGWRGTAAGAGRAAVRAMEATFGSNPAEIVAAIGPCLGACCGEVGPEVVEAFRVAGHASRDIERWFTIGKTSRPYLDLERANRDQLVLVGVAPGPSTRRDSARRPTETGCIPIAPTAPAPAACWRRFERRPGRPGEARVVFLERHAHGLAVVPDDLPWSARAGIALRG